MIQKSKNNRTDGSQGDLHSLVIWIASALVTIVLSSTAILIIWPLSQIFDRRLFVMHRVARLWGRILITINSTWRIKITGLQHLKPKTPYVIVANHQSIADILALLMVLPLQFKFVAKKELFAVPFMGWHMSAAGYMALDRSSRESGKTTLFRSIRWLEQGASVLFFAEGTRSRDGSIHPFKPGAFKVARDAGVEVLPVVIDGTGSAVPKHSWKLTTPSCFRLDVGSPVSLDGVFSEDLPRTAERIRQEMILRLKKMHANHFGAVTEFGGSALHGSHGE